MIKNYIFKFTLIIIPVSAFILMSNSGGVLAGRSGSPGDGGASCAACHTGGSSGASANITTDIPEGGYALNTTYTITVDKSSSAAGGFQMVAENDANQRVGTFAAGSTTRTSNSNDRITHNSSSNSSWTFQWTSPSSDVGNIRFFGSVVVANGDGSNGAGDRVVNVSTTGAAVLSASAENQLTFDIFPNPSSNMLSIQLPSGSEEGVAQFFDYRGKNILSQSITSRENKIDIQPLASGVYLLKVISEGKVGTQKFIKN